MVVPIVTSTALVPVGTSSVLALVGVAPVFVPIVLPSFVTFEKPYVSSEQATLKTAQGGRIFLPKVNNISQSC